MAGAEKNAGAGQRESTSSDAPSNAVWKDQKQQDNEDISQAARRMFQHVSSFLRGELSLSSQELALLAAMNERAAGEYDKLGDYAEGLSVFIERLGQKNEILKEYLANVEEIDRQVTDLEAVVSALDGYTHSLESRLRSASTHSSTSWNLGLGRPLI